MLDQEQDRVVRQGWVLTLGRVPQDEMRAALVRLLQTERSPVVLSALIRRVRDQRLVQAIPALVALTEHEDGVLRLEAATALGELGDERVRPALQRLLTQHETPGRQDPSGSGMMDGHTIAAAQEAFARLGQDCSPDSAPPEAQPSAAS
ncbi:HEAT repeat domain-containing protein [Deinococcus sonorensis]|uniref:HEAT repeat domain-containing protein n=2 Tax=Deinococcus sonorensis TaxID=309891 RepID=A0AAU7U6R0_9DEIO